MTTKYVVTDEHLAAFSRRVFDLEGRLRKGVVNPEFTLEHLQQATENINPFADATAPQIRAWENFYQKYFNMKKVDFSQVIIPELRPGFNRLEIVAKGMMPQKAFAACSQKFKTFKTWTYVDDLNKAITSEDRSAEKSAYAIWVRNRVEADKELKNKSADTLKQDGIQGITLTERLLYELKYYDETGKHLDINNVTLCSGSRDSDGDVPRVGWHDSELQVDLYSTDFVHGYLRSREVVSA